MSDWFLFVAVTLEVEADNTVKPGSSLKVAYDVSMKSAFIAIMNIEAQKAADTVCKHITWSFGLTCFIGCTNEWFIWQQNSFRITWESQRHYEHYWKTFWCKVFNFEFFYF